MSTPDTPHDTRLPSLIDGKSIDADWFQSNTIRIAKFDQVFIKADSRKIMERRSPLLWISQPTGFTSRGYHSLFDHFEPVMAMAVYGCFNCLVKLAGKPPEYGALSHENGAGMTLGYITRETFAPAELVIQTVRWGLTVGWLTSTPSGCHPDGIPTPSGSHPDYSTGQNQTGPDDTEPEQDNKPHGNHGALFSFSEQVWRDLTDSNVRELARKPVEDRLRELFRVGVKHWKWPDDGVHWLKFLAMVRHCGTNSKIRHPAAALKANLKERAFHLLTDSDEAWAQQTARQWNRSQPAAAMLSLAADRALPTESCEASRQSQLDRLKNLDGQHFNRNKTTRAGPPIGTATPVFPTIRNSG